MNTEPGEREEAPKLLLDGDELVAEMNTAAENLVGEWYRESQHRDELVEEVAVTLAATHRRAEANAATRMRERCVSVVKEIPMPTHLSESGEEIVTHFRARVVRYLESLTLDGEKEHGNG